jgi:hypothetical protein
MPGVRTDGDVIQVEAPSGVVWTRCSGGRTTPSDLLRELEKLGKGIVEQEWDWWQEGRRDREHKRQMEVLREWENGAVESTEDVDAKASAKAYMEDFDRRCEAKRQQREALVAERYDQQREGLRRTMLRAEADAAFFGHVLKQPASSAQAEKAEQHRNKHLAAVAQMRETLGDPEDVIDRHGFYPADRRRMNLSSHMNFWRHRALRELHSGKQRKRFNVLLAMRPPEPDTMCSECEAPSMWHEFDISLCLFKGAPKPGSTAERIAALMPGWWERCAACTAYQIHHQWGHDALPDFDGSQWAAMLPPVLNEVFAPSPPKPRTSVVRPKPLAVISAGSVDEVFAQLAQARGRFPGATVRAGARGTWELWPGP